MEVIPTSQPCQTYSWQPMLLLPFCATEKHAGEKSSESVFVLIFYAYPGKLPARRTVPGPERAEFRYKTQILDQIGRPRKPSQGCQTT